MATKVKSSPSESTPSQESLLAAYSQAVDSMRLYVNTRFAHLAVYISINAGLFSVLKDDMNAPYRSWLPIAGLVSAAVFWAIENSCTDHYWIFRERAIQIESQLYLKLHQFDRQMEGGFVNQRQKVWTKYTTATYAIETLFRFLATSWAYLFLQNTVNIQLSAEMKCFLIVVVTLFVASPIFLRTYLEKNPGNKT